MMLRRLFFILACSTILYAGIAQDMTSFLSHVSEEFKQSEFILDQEIVGESTMLEFFDMMSADTFDCLSDNQKELLTFDISEEWKYKLKAFKEDNIQVWSKSFLKEINRGKKLKGDYTKLIRLSHPIILGTDAFIYVKTASGNEFYYYQYKNNAWIKICQYSFVN